MRRSPLVVLYFAVFLDTFGFGLVLPALPFFVMQRVGESATWGGAILVAYSLGQLLGAPVLGRLSDRLGRRPVLLGSLAASTLALIATGLADSLWWLLCARFFAGLFAAAAATAQAYVADLTAPEERARYMGLLGAAVASGFVFGPAVGGLLGQHGMSTAAFTGAALAGANLLLALFVLRESRPAGARRQHARKPFGQMLREVRAQPAVVRLILVTSAIMLGFVFMEATFPFLGKRNVDMGPRLLGLVFTYVGVIAVVVQGGLLGHLSRRFGERALAMTGASSMALALLAMPFARDYGALLAAVGAMALGSGLSTPSLQTLLSRATDAADQGSVMGLNQSVLAAMRALGPGLAGAMYDVSAYLPYTGAAALIGGSVWALRALPRASSEGPSLEPGLSDNPAVLPEQL